MLVQALWNSRDQVIGISSHMYSHTRGTDVHPQNAKKLARATSLRGKCIKLRYGG